MFCWNCWPITAGFCAKATGCCPGAAITIAALYNKRYPQASAGRPRRGETFRRAVRASHRLAWSDLARMIELATSKPLGVAGPANPGAVSNCGSRRSEACWRRSCWRITSGMRPRGEACAHDLAAGPRNLSGCADPFGCRHAGTGRASAPRGKCSGDLRLFPLTAASFVDWPVQIQRHPGRRRSWSRHKAVRAVTSNPYASQHALALDNPSPAVHSPRSWRVDTAIPAAHSALLTAHQRAVDPAQRSTSAVCAVRLTPWATDTPTTIRRTTSMFGKTKG